MPKQKQKRSKAYKPKPERLPAFLYDTCVPPITDEEYRAVIEIVMRSLDLVKLGTWDIDLIQNINAALRIYWKCAGFFENTDEHRLLATCASAALMALHTEVRTATKTGAPVKPAVIQACTPQIEDAVHAYAEMIQNMKRSELYAAYKASETFNLAERVRREVHGGAWLVNPDADEDTSSKIYGVRGVIYINRMPRVGYLDEKDGRLVWVMPALDMIAVIEKPVLIALLDQNKFTKRVAKEDAKCMTFPQN